MTKFYVNQQWKQNGITSTVVELKTQRGISLVTVLETDSNKQVIGRYTVTAKKLARDRK